jgi:hypothetical protein
VAALRCVLEKHRDEAVGLLQRYRQADRDLLFTLLRLSGHVGERELERVPPQELALMLDQLNTLALALRLRAPLALEKVCFCRKIVTFGVYDPLGPLPEFQAETPGRPGERVQVYAEVRNFASREVVSREADPYFETFLAGALEIFNLKGERVHQISMRPCVDRCRTLRQDYFIVFDFPLPPLPAGSYVLWVQVKDVTPGPGGAVTPRVARRSLDFRVGGQVQGPRANMDRQVPAAR